MITGGGVWAEEIDHVPPETPELARKYA